MQCKGCGVSYEPSDHFCRNCGMPLAQAVEDKNEDAAEISAPVTQAVKQQRVALKAIGIAVVFFSLLMVMLVKVAPDLLKGTAFKPKDLGVQWTQNDYRSILAKSKVQSDIPPDGTDRAAYRDEYIGQQDVDWTLTDSEISAWLNTEKQPGYWPFSAVQFKLHKDNIIELSFRADPKKLMTFGLITKQMPQEINTFISRIPLQLPVYAKVQVTFTAPKQVSIRMMAFDASGIAAADMALSEQANQIVSSIISEMFGQIDAVNVTSFTTTDGSLHLKGTWYKEIKRVSIK
jgi:hypothetical protein